MLPFKYHVSYGATPTLISIKPDTGNNYFVALTKNKSILDLEHPLKCLFPSYNLMIVANTVHREEPYGNG